MSERTDALLEQTVGHAVPLGSRRRDDLVGVATAAGHTREYAQLVYDVAQEIDLDPGLAFDVVLAGVGVRILAEAPADHWEETQVGAPPDWVAAERSDAEDAGQERVLRLTFRRLHGLLQQYETAAEAMRAFVREPDVGDVDY